MLTVQYRLVYKVVILYNPIRIHTTIKMAKRLISMASITDEES
jgi:hypothetical protein